MTVKECILGVDIGGTRVAAGLVTDLGEIVVRASTPISFRQKGRPYYAPKLEKRTALFEKLREVFRRHVSWPIEVVIAKINPILRGWVNTFGTVIRVPVFQKSNSG